MNTTTTKARTIAQRRSRSSLTWVDFLVIAAIIVTFAAIVTYTNTGSTTLRAARERPDVRILCLTPNLNTARRLTLAWGVHSVHGKDAKNFADMVQRAVRVARDEEIARDGQRLVITAGVPFGTPGATNILRIAYVSP